jgi:tetratricopeptide (TPR) repeat protein
LQRSIEVLQSILQREPDYSNARAKLADALGSYGWLMSMTQLFDKAQERWRQACEHWVILRTEHPEHVGLVSQLAHAHFMLGDAILGGGISQWKDAETELQTALAIQREAITQPDATNAEKVILAAILCSLGRIARVTSRLDEARKHLGEAAAICQQLRPDEPSVLSQIEGCCWRKYSHKHAAFQFSCMSFQFSSFQFSLSIFPFKFTIQRDRMQLAAE